MCINDHDAGICPGTPAVGRKLVRVNHDQTCVCYTSDFGSWYVSGENIQNSCG